MMKTKILMSIIAFFWAMLIASCSEEENGNTPPDDKPITALISKICIEWEEEWGTASFEYEYDKDDNITKVIANGDDMSTIIYSYKRSGNTLTIQAYTSVQDSPNEVYDIFKATLDAKGRIRTAKYYGDGSFLDINHEYVYSNNGDLIGYTSDCNDFECKFTWSDENISKYEYVYKYDGAVTGGVQFYSSLYVNLTNIDFTELLSVPGHGYYLGGDEILVPMFLRSTGYLGNKQTSLPAKVIIYEFGEVKYEATYEFKYEFNADNLPKNIVIKYNDNDDYDATSSIARIRVVYK